MLYFACIFIYNSIEGINMSSVYRIIAQFKDMDESKLLEIHAYNLSKDWKNGRIALGKPNLKKDSTLAQMRLVEQYLTLLQKPTLQKVKEVYGITGITLTSEFKDNLVVMGNRKPTTGSGHPQANLSTLLGIFLTQATYNNNTGVWKALIGLSIGNQKEYRRILKQLENTIQKHFKIINKYVSNVRICVKYQLYGGVEQWSSTPWDTISNYAIPNWLLHNIGVDYNYLSQSTNNSSNIDGVIEKILKVEILWK